MKYIVLLLSVLIIGCQNTTEHEQQIDKINAPLIGTWNTHYQQTFLTISIESDNTAVIYWDYDGSHSTERIKWRPLKNGLIIDTFPRIRLWNIDEPNYIIAKIEAFDPFLGSEKANEFPKTRRMKRVFQSENQQRNMIQFIIRPLPAGWEKDQPNI